MKKKVLLGLILTIMVMLTINVNAKIMSKDEIENDSYVIGKYMFVHGTEAGILTTSKMLLAAKSIDANNGLSDIVVYYKNFLGNWINGITGDEIDAPTTFEIVNRNMHDIIAAPDMDCKFPVGSSNDGITTRQLECTSSVMIDNNLNYASVSYNQSDNNLVDINGREFYIILNNDNTLPDTKAYYDPVTGKFRTNNAVLKVEKLCNGDDGEGSCVSLKDFDSINDNNNCENSFCYQYDSTSQPLYQIVSRVYFIDGIDKIYSEYSNIQTNGALAKFGLDDTSIKLSATINENYAVKVDSSLGNVGSGLNGEVNYYNVKFNLANVDTTQYMIREYRVYSSVRALSGLGVSHINDYTNAEGGSDTLEYLYMESLAMPKYKNLRRLVGVTPNVYLIADSNGANAVGGYSDMSSSSCFSKRLYWSDDVSNDESRAIFARATICNTSQSECYEIDAHINPTTGNQSYVR